MNSKSYFSMFLITLFCVLTVGIQEYRTESVNYPPIEIHKLSQEKLHKLIESTEYDPKGQIWEIGPKSRQFTNDVNMHNKLSGCYDSSIGNHHLDIFTESIGEIVKKFFKFNRNLVRIGDFEEAKKRIQIVLDNVKRIAKSTVDCLENLKNPEFQPTKLGITPFAVYTHEEFLSKFTTKIVPSTNSSEKPKPCPLKVDKRFKHQLYRMHKFDWRDHQMVTPVRHQEECNSCFIYAATGALESAYRIQQNNTQNNTQFSEQPFLNCLPDACDRGTVSSVWDRAIVEGVTTVQDSPNHIWPEKCKSTRILAKATDYCMNHPLTSDFDLKALIYTYGPVTVAVNANHPNFAHLHNTPWLEPCDPTPTHSVLAVGWDRDYWILKNSWGTEWGIGGYLYLPMDNQDICGIYFEAGIPFFRAINENSVRMGDLFLS